MNLQTAVLSLDYEAQHFGFHPRSFFDEVYNVFFENVSTSLTQLKHFLIHEFNEVLPPNVIKSQTDNMLIELGSLCARSIDKLEVYLNNNVFKIPSHVILPEDKIHVTRSCTKEENENIDKELEEIKRRILEEKAKRLKLKKIINEQKQVKERLFHFQNELKYLLQIAVEENCSEERIKSLYLKLENLFCDLLLGIEL